MNKQLRKYVVAVVLLIAFASGCTTHTTYFDVRHAPELRLTGVRSIKIEAFHIGQCDLIGPRNFRQKSVNALVDVIVDPFLEVLIKKEEISVENFRESVAKAIASNGTYVVALADDFDVRLRGEINCSTPGEVDRYRHKNSDGKISDSYELNQTAHVVVKFSVVDRSGKTIGWTSVETSERTTRTGATEGEVRSMAERPASLVDKALTKAAELLVRKVAPYTVRERRTLETSDSSAIKSGNEAANNENWQDAAKFWDDASRSANLADRIAGLHNLAIHDERQGKLREAQKKYEQIYSLTSDHKYQLEAARIEAQIEEETWLRTEFGQK